MGKIFEAWKKLGFKLTGKKIKDSENLSTIINDIADKYEGGGGTNVVANPTLAGTEADLTGLQVGDTKYKVSGGGSLSDKYEDVTALLDAVGTVLGHDFATTYPVLDVEALRNLLVKYNFDFSSKMEIEQTPGSGWTPNMLKFIVSGTETRYITGSGFSNSEFCYEMYLYAKTGSSATHFKAQNDVDGYDEQYQFSSTLSEETATWNDVLDKAISDNMNLILGHNDSGTGVHTVLGNNSDVGIWDDSYKHSATFGNICLCLESIDDGNVMTTFITYVKPEDFVTIFKFVSL